MKHRYFRTLLSLLLVLILLFTTLPLQASSLPAPAYFHFRGTIDGEMHFTWQSVPYEESVVMEFKCVCLADVWFKVHLLRYWRMREESNLATIELGIFEQYPMRMRIKVTTPHGDTKWAETKYTGGGGEIDSGYGGR